MYIMERSKYIRDTLISKEVFNSLPKERQDKINVLVDKFDNLGYIDVRYCVGPDQAGRMSDRQRKQILNTTTQVFEIERQIKLLLRSDEQIAKDEKEATMEKLSAEISATKNSISILEKYCNHKLSTNRNNATKREVHRLTAKLTELLKQQQQ